MEMGKKQFLSCEYYWKNKLTRIFFLEFLKFKMKSFWQIVLKQPDTHMQKNKVGPLLHTIYKMKSPWFPWGPWIIWLY